MQPLYIQSNVGGNPPSSRRSTHPHPPTRIHAPMPHVCVDEVVACSHPCRRSFQRRETAFLLCPPAHALVLASCRHENSFSLRAINVFASCLFVLLSLSLTRIVCVRACVSVWKRVGECGCGCVYKHPQPPRFPSRLSRYTLHHSTHSTQPRTETDKPTNRQKGKKTRQ